MNSVVIGSGFGGIAAALRLKAKGHDVTLIEKHKDLGGRARVFEKNGFKFDRSSRKWTVENLPIDNAEEFASYCRKYGLTFERSDRMITEFDYADYLWDGRRDEFMKPSENIEIPQPKNKI